MVDEENQVIIEQEPKTNKKKHFLHSSFTSGKLGVFINIFIFFSFLSLLIYIKNQQEKKIIVLEKDIESIKITNFEQNKQINDLKNIISKYSDSFHQLEEKISQIDLLQKKNYEINKKFEDFERVLNVKNLTEKQDEPFKNCQSPFVDFKVICEKIYQLAKDGKDFSFDLQDLYKIDPKSQENILLEKLEYFATNKTPSLEELKQEWKNLASVLKQEIIFSKPINDKENINEDLQLEFWQKIWQKISKIIRVEKVKKDNNKNLILEKITEMIELKRFNDILKISEEIGSNKFIIWKNKLQKRIELEEILENFIVWYKNYGTLESEHKEKL